MSDRFGDAKCRVPHVPGRSPANIGRPLWVDSGLFVDANHKI